MVGGRGLERRAWGILDIAPFCVAPTAEWNLLLLKSPNPSQSPLHANVDLSMHS